MAAGNLLRLYLGNNVYDQIVGQAGENPTVVHQSFYNLVARYGELYGVEDYIDIIWFG